MKARSTDLTPVRIKTVRRPKDRARLVITLEVGVDLKEAPRWQSDALDVIRDRLADIEVGDYLLALRNLLSALGISTYDIKAEAAK